MIEQNIQLQKSLNILLIGDKCVDVYTYGTVDRLSPEAPIPIFNKIKSETKPGMADNVRLNLEKLGCKVNFLHTEECVKERIIDQRSKQQIVRIDSDTMCTPITIMSEIPDVYDAIVISDYDKGSVTYELIEELISTSIPVFIDTKKQDLQRMQGAWVKINEIEYVKLYSECSGLIVTLGDKGAWAKHHDVFVEAPKVEVVDVTGAGDTFLAALAYMFLKTKNINDAMTFATKAASVTVKNMGCYAPALEEIQ